MNGFWERISAWLSRAQINVTYIRTMNVFGGNSRPTAPRSMPRAISGQVQHRPREPMNVALGGFGPRHGLPGEVFGGGQHHGEMGGEQRLDRSKQEGDKRNESN
jgi:hypothetical protein